MPSVSKNQQQAAGQALAAKRGEIPVSDLQGAAKDMYDSMSEKQLEDFAKTKHAGLPEKVSENRIKKSEVREIIREEIQAAVAERQAIEGQKVLNQLHKLLSKLKDTDGKPFQFRIKVEPGVGDRSNVQVNMFGKLAGLSWDK